MAWLRRRYALVLAGLLLLSQCGLVTTSFVSPIAAEEASAATPDHRALPAEPLAPSAINGRMAVLDRLGVTAWHRLGCLGAGIKVAVLDSGFRGYRAHLGRALPAQVRVHSFRADGNLEAKDSQHGILCGEVIHALAPEAELLFANWEPDRPDQFLSAVRWAREQGARLISCSVIMPSWSDGEGTGKVHSDLSKILGTGKAAGDLLFFASAGNTAQRSWSGNFNDAGNGQHAWAPGVVDNPIRPWSTGERVSVELCGDHAIGLEVVLRDDTAAEEVGRGSATATRAAVVRFSPRDQHNYSVRVVRHEGKANAFHLVVLSGGLGVAQCRGSIPFPGDGPEVVAVGAVDETGHRLAYSSCGPNSSCPKPDLVAPVPFPSQWRSRPFAGTSAASPQAAALAALLWSRHADWSASHVRDTLKAAALDLGPPGHDCETGFGQIRLP